VYYPKQFHALRVNYCGGDFDYLQSLSRCHKWKATGGKSGSTFSKTRDDRYILKYISRKELEMFQEGALAYFGYMAKAAFHNLPTVLVRMLGLYQISWKRNNNKEGMKSKYVIVMPNLFYDKKMERIFDLKGSVRNRYVKKKGRDAKRVLLDSNLMEYTNGFPIPLHEVSKAILRMSVFNDTLFLSGLEVVDYSILVGFDSENNELVVGIIGTYIHCLLCLSISHRYFPVE
jgi:1-phosphatidylinositol-3-phosphate 5-kinase